jgi:hypothetical protein
MLAIAPGAHITFPKSGCYPNRFEDVHFLLDSEYKILEKNIGSKRLELLGMMKMSEHSAYGRGLKEELIELTEKKIKLKREIEKETAFAGYSEYQADESFQSKIRNLQLELKYTNNKISLWKRQLKDMDRHTVAAVKFKPDGTYLGIRTVVDSFPRLPASEENPHGCVMENHDVDFDKHLAQIFKLMEAIGLVPIQKTQDGDDVNIYSFFKDKPVNISTARVRIINFKYFSWKVIEFRGEPTEKDYDYGAYNAIKNYMDKHEIPYFKISSGNFNIFYHPSYIKFERIICTTPDYHPPEKSEITYSPRFKRPVDSILKDATFIYIPPYPDCFEYFNSGYDKDTEESLVDDRSWEEEQLFDIDKKKLPAEPHCWRVKWDLESAPEKQKQLREKYKDQY